MTAANQKRIGIAIIIILILIICFGACNFSNLKKDKNRLENNITALQDSVKYKNNAIGTITASKKALEVTEKELKEQTWIKDAKLAALQKEFNKIINSTKITSTVEVPEIKVPYKDTIPCVFERQQAVRDSWYSFDAKSTQKGFTIENLTIPNEQYIITGMKRDGLFKPLYLTVDVANTNPYIKTNDIKSQVVQVKQPFYNKVWFKVAIFAAGVAAGAAAAN
jgi:hypothetical protein